LTQASRKPAGFLTFTLHAHLPYVVNHGTWPHGMEWLHEAAAETYLPLLRVLANLDRDNIRFHCNLNLSPILLEQLAHPVFIAEFPRYLTRKIVASQEDEAFFLQSGETHYAETARFWNAFFTSALNDFNALGGSIVSGFRHFNDIGLIDIITCCATHGYLPLLGTDESVRAQIRTGVDTHIRHFGRAPKGIWAPECGYRPSGLWSYPVHNADGTPTPPAFDRIGIEQAISESDLDFFFVDTHLVEEGHRILSPYDLRNNHLNDDDLRSNTVSPPSERDPDNLRTLYHPYFVDGPYIHHDGRRDESNAATIFPRDPQTGIQVWSGDHGYPGDAVYLDFHKKRWPGGHRYWRVTGTGVDMNDKLPYFPKEAAERVKGHAAHFVHLVWQALNTSFDTDVPPILCAPFDAELFGHWWFEGALWLEAVARNLHDFDSGIELTTCAEYLSHFPRASFLCMHEGSWGAEGKNQVWLNPETGWTYTHIYPAELYTREVATAGRWRDSDKGRRIVGQLCRELLLLEASDWQFLITTGAARDYAELRFLTHNDQFNQIKAIWQTFDDLGSLSPEQEGRLAEIHLRDNIFPDIDPALWAAGAHATRTSSREAPGTDPSEAQAVAPSMQP
jgi:1,4-alpha-glucan branching enzyme